MEEKTFFHQGSVTVTSSRFINGSQTYVMSNVSSVKAFVERPKRTGGYIVALVTLLMSFASPAVGLPGLMITLWYLYQQKTMYHVMLSTTGGESSALSTENQGYVEDVVEALNQAIVHRG